MSDCRVPMPVYEKPVMRDVKEIVAQYLKACGLDGLYNEVGCGCDLSDLMPCDSPCDRCEPAYKTYCPCCGEDVFVPVRVCRKADDEAKSTLADLFGILADKNDEATPIDGSK